MYTHASCDPVYIYFCPVLTNKFNNTNSIRKELYQYLHKNKRIHKTFNEKKEKEKQGRGRKTTDETRDGLILILVRCLDEIFRLAVKSNCVMEILGCISADYCEERVIESTMLHNHDNSNIANEALKENNILHQFLLEKIQPILEQLLHRSQYREFEVT